VRLSYASAAYTVERSGRDIHSKKEQRRKADIPVPTPSSFTRALRALSRVTISLEDEAQVFALNGAREVLRAYDVVAVSISSEAVLERCLAPPAIDLIDLIALPSAGRLPFHLKHSLARRAVRAGLSFELCYTAALQDGASRRNFISNLQALLEVLPRRKTGGRGDATNGLVLSSGAEDERLLRSAHDVVNLLTVFGCDAASAEQAVSSNCERLLCRAAKRLLMPPLASPPPRSLFELPAALETGVASSLEFASSLQMGPSGRPLGAGAERPVKRAKS